MKINLNKNLLSSALVASLFAVSQPLKAEDIELYVNYDIEITEKPRVVVVFDTSGSMAWDVTTGKKCSTWWGGEVPCENSRLNVAKAAISDLVITNPDVDFGLMRFSSESGKGGYVVNGLGVDSAAMLASVDNLPADGATPLSETLYEAYRYLIGGNVDQATKMSKRDKSVESNSRYISPFIPKEENGEVTLRCDNSINMILMTDGDPTSDTGRNDKIKALFPSGSKPSPIKNDGGDSNYLHALADHLYNNDLWTATPDVKDVGRTYTIGFGTGMSDKGKYLLEKTALQGGGTFLHANTAEELSDALKKAIMDIREVNDTFTSPSVASNNTDRTQSHDSLYYAMFYPEKGARWKGNLKKLKLVDEAIVDSSTPPLPAIDESGSIAKDARTYWLPSNEPADGNIVLAGGVNLVLETTSKRKLYTDFGSKSALYDFSKNAANNLGISDTDLSTLMQVDKTELEGLFGWSQGIDVLDENNDGSVTDQREDIMGDPLHSKPVAIDYGNGDIRILIGTNAGFVHMFQDSGDTVKENWGFIPYELFDNLSALKSNKQDTKVYGMDLTPAIFFDDQNDDGIVNGNDRVWTYFGMRRGGSAYYALDITSPDSPKLKFSLSNKDSGFAEMGQSWSKPYIGYIKVNGYQNKPLLIFGAGYDINKDNVTKTEDNKGQGVFIADADTGKLVWSFTPLGNTLFPGVDGIPGDITTLDSDYDGYIDRLYASDTGGNIWRFDLPGSEPKSSDTPWTVFKLAELGSKNTIDDRRFFYQSTVARTYFSKVTEVSEDNNGVITKTVNREETPFEAIVIGSGNRSHPTYTTTSNHLYMIRDENTITKSFIRNIPSPIKVTDLESVNDDPFGSVLDDKDAFEDVEIEFSKFKGWHYTLALGEKALSEATVAGGVAYYSTFTPADDSNTNQCSLSGGGGLLYAFHLHYGTKVYDTLAMDVGDTIPDTAQIVFDQDKDGNSQLLLIGVGDGENGSGVIKAKSVVDSLVPVDKDGDGKIDIVEPDPLGLKTIRSYIYRYEDY